MKKKWMKFSKIKPKKVAWIHVPQKGLGYNKVEKVFEWSSNGDLKDFVPILPSKIVVANWLLNHNVSNVC